MEIDDIDYSDGLSEIDYDHDYFSGDEIYDDYDIIMKSYHDCSLDLGRMNEYFFLFHGESELEMEQYIERDKYYDSLDLDEMRIYIYYFGPDETNDDDDHTSNDLATKRAFI